MKKTGKEALLLWCKKKTENYSGVDVTNFSASWRDGLALCALVHSIKPSLLAFDKLNRSDEIGNLNLAFTAAEKLGVPKLLDAEDMSPGPPEPFSMITYLSTLYHAAMKLESSGGSQSPVKRPSDPPRPKSTAIQPLAKASAPVKPAVDSANTQRSTISTPDIIPDISGPKCAKCQQQANGVMVNWGNNLFHQDCFKCAGCNKGFRNTALNIEGMPYCDTCGRKAFIKSRLNRHTMATSPQQASPSDDSHKSQAETKTSPATSVVQSTTNRTSPATSVVQSTTNRTSPATPVTQSSQTKSPSTASQSPQTQTTLTNPSANPARSTIQIVSEVKKETRQPSASVSSGIKPASTESSSSPSPAVNQTKPIDSANNTVGGSDKNQNKPIKENTVQRDMRIQKEKEEELKKQRARATTAIGGMTSKPSAIQTPASQSSSPQTLVPSQTSKPRVTSMAVPRESGSKTEQVTPINQASSQASISIQQKSPERQETIIEKEIRLQKEKEDELKAARERARSVRPATTSISALTAKDSPTTSASFTKPKQDTPAVTNPVTAKPEKQESIIEKEMRLQKEKEDELSRSKERAKSAYSAFTSTSTNEKPAATNQVSYQSISTPNIKQESIIEKEMRLQREKEEELRIARQRATMESNTTKVVPETKTETQIPEKIPEQTSSDTITVMPKENKNDSVSVPVTTKSVEINLPETTVIQTNPPLESNLEPIEQPSITVEEIASSSATQVEDVRMILPPAPSRATSSAFEEADNEVELPDEDVNEDMKRATISLRRVDVTKVARGHQGFLKKRDRTAAIKLFWSTLWFSLQDNRLLYYKEAMDKNSLAAEHPPEGFLSLQFITSIRKSTASDKRFVIEGPGVEWDMKASSKEEAMEWIEAMQDAVTMYNLTEKNKRAISAPVFGQVGSDDMVMEGYLNRHATFGWTKNYWLLQDGMLFYFSSQGGKRIGRIPLYKCEFAPYDIDSSKEAIRAFCITTYQNEKIILAAKDEMEMHKWLNCMLRQRIVIEEAIDMISF